MLLARGSAGPSKLTQASGEWTVKMRRGSNCRMSLSTVLVSGSLPGYQPWLGDDFQLRDGKLRLRSTPLAFDRVFADLVGFVERGEITPIVAGTFPLEAIHEAQSAFERKDHVGALVIDMSR